MELQHNIDSLIRYRDHKIPTGGFLNACLTNDLMGAFMGADDSSRKHLFEIMNFIYNEMPSNTWGSYEKVRKHLADDQTDKKLSQTQETK